MAEQETVIRLDDTTARITTSDPDFIDQLDELVKNEPDICTRFFRSEGFCAYQIPAEYVQFMTPVEGGDPKC